jgi:hypothetical protein
MKQKWFNQGGMEILLLVAFSVVGVAWCMLLGRMVLFLKMIMGGS